MPELAIDRQRIDAGAVLAVPARREPPRLERVAPGGLAGAVVALVIRGRGARAAAPLVLDVPETFLLTMRYIVGKVANMKAVLIYRMDHEFDDGSRAVGVIWRVPSPVNPSVHEFKYRLVYLVGGLRVVGFDNERGKGDHKHFDDDESPYQFVSPSRLVDDFISEVERWNAY